MVDNIYSLPNPVALAQLGASIDPENPLGLQSSAHVPHGRMDRKIIFYTFR